MNKDEVLKKQKEYLFPAVGNYYKEPLVVARAKGKFVYDLEGREFLDFFGGILTVSVGHCNDKVNDRVTRQNGTLQHVSTLYPTEPIVLLAEKLASITPGNLRKSFFTSSGTEADETAVTLAQIHTGADEIVALRHAYSGRSVLARALTAHAPWRLTAAQVPFIRHLANPYCYRCPFGLTYPSCELRCARDLEDLIQTTTTGRIAAFMAEPIQGVGGFITPPKEYFKVVAEIARKYGGLFISDEVQTGFGRTGDKWFGIEHWGVEPDIMTMAKGIANGAPMGVTIARPEVADSLKGLTIATFGGNPVSCTAALATIQVMEEEGLARNAKVLGDHLRSRLLELQTKYKSIGDVRGMGLMQALELVKAPGKEPNAPAVVELFERTKAAGLLIGKGGLYGNVVRISPPLNITKDDVDTACGIFDRCLAEMKA
ncbi:MAG: aspartate aminotransferase family protein [Planctomycetes bacterium]|nr:aspartate aminotransferase family protein [Planctomycetota bacterium]